MLQFYMVWHFLCHYWCRVADQPIRVNRCSTKPSLDPIQAQTQPQTNKTSPDVYAQFSGSRKHEAVIQPVWLQLTVALKFFISIIYYFRNFVTQMFQYGYYIIPQYFGKRVKMPLYPSSRNLELQIIMRIMSKKGLLNVCKEPLYWNDRSSDLESSTSPSQAFRK